MKADNKVTAEDFKEMLNPNNELFNGFYGLTFSKEEIESVYNSLKRLEELEAKQNPTPKYVLARDVPSIGAKRGDECYKSNTQMWCLKKPDMKDPYIGIGEALDPALIEEVKPRELFLNEYKKGFTGFHYDTLEKALREKIEKDVRTIKFIEVL